MDKLWEKNCAEAHCIDRINTMRALSLFILAFLFAAKIAKKCDNSKKIRLK
jgi:hypothetical protein